MVGLRLMLENNETPQRMDLSGLPFEDLPDLLKIWGIPCLQVKLIFTLKNGIHLVNAI